MTDLEQRLQQQEDLEAIRRLKHYNYCHCVDRAVAGESAAIEQTVSRFTDEVVADFTGFPLAEGREAVTAFYAHSVPSILSYSQHHVFNEVIDIDGDLATGRWYVHCPVVFTEASPAGQVAPGLVMGRYEEEYIRQDGLWRWRRIVALLDVVAPGQTTWVGTSQLFANPDR